MKNKLQEAAEMFSLKHKDIFIAGANWQKEQDANEAVEFAEWILNKKNITKGSYASIKTNDKIWWDDDKYISFSSTKLYEIFKQSKNIENEKDNNFWHHNTSNIYSFWHN